MFWKWWTLVVGLAAAVSTGQYYFDIFQYVLDNDATYISWVIILLFMITTLSMGKLSYFTWKFPHAYLPENTTKIHWFAAEACMGLGMIGTLIGFLIVLSSAFTNLDVESTEAIKAVVGSLATGMGTALLTTLVGLTSSLLLKFQLITWEKANEG